MRPTELRSEKPLPQPRKARPLRRSAEVPFAAPTPVFLASNRETDESYGSVIAVLNSKLRVISGSCSLQWIVQKRKNPLMWVSFAFCATREGLLLRLPKGGQGCEPKAWAVVEALPPYFRLSSLVTETM